MKKALFLTIALILAILAASCVGPIIGAGRGMTMQPKEKLGIQQPLKIEKSQALETKRVALVNLYDLGKKSGKQISEDDIRLYNAMLFVLNSELKKAKRFELVTPFQFKKKQEEMGLLADIFLMSEEERRADAAKIGQALQCDGIIVLAQKTKKVDMAKSFFQYGFVGTVDVPVVILIELIGSKTGEALYYQEQEATYSSGGVGLKNTPDDELKNLVTPLVQPLVADLLSCFGK